jgi:hypothetical protein
MIIGFQVSKRSEEPKLGSNAAEDHPDEQGRAEARGNGDKLESEQLGPYAVEHVHDGRLQKRPQGP